MKETHSFPIRNERILLFGVFFLMVAGNLFFYYGLCSQGEVLKEILKIQSRSFTNADLPHLIRIYQSWERGLWLFGFLYDPTIIAIARTLERKDSELNLITYFFWGSLLIKFILVMCYS